VNNATARVNHPPAGDAQRTPRPAPGPKPPREEREIESWLGELRGTAPAANQPASPPQRPSADATRAMPEQRPRQQRPAPPPGNEPTTAIPAQRPRPQNADATTAIPSARQQDPESTEKINTREDDEPQRRGGGGGLSAQDLLRREGRL
jgi:RND superfamily putative drug exporter